MKIAKRQATDHFLVLMLPILPTGFEHEQE